MLIISKLSFQDRLSISEKSIANYLLEKGAQIIDYSIRTLADDTYTSPATIVRFCKKLGFSGFEEFKKEFIKELEYLDQSSGAVDFNFPFSKEDTPRKVANRIVALYEETIHDTISLLYFEELRKAVTLLRSHCKIYIYSWGTAMNQAESFREKMLKIGHSVIISNNLNYQLYEVQSLSSTDVAIIISYSGETPQIVQIAKECRRRFVPIIAITSFGENSLTQYASCKLTLSTKESIYQNLGDYSSHLSINLLLDILYSAYFLENYDKNYQNKLDKARQLEKHRTSSNSILMDMQTKEDM